MEITIVRIIIISLLTWIVVIDKWGPGEKFDVEQNGIQILLAKDQIIGSLRDAWQTYQLFQKLDKNTEKENLQFIKDYMNITLEKRTSDPIILDESLIHSGDYFAISRLQGADTIIMYGTGGMTGHTAVALWIGDELFVVESTGVKDYWPAPYGVIRTPYRKWMKQAIEGNWVYFFVNLV
jgi:type III secretory pathway component EscR